MLTTGVISREPGEEPDGQLEGIWKEHLPMTLTEAWSREGPRIPILCVVGAQLQASEDKVGIEYTPNFSLLWLQSQLIGLSAEK